MRIKDAEMVSVHQFKKFVPEEHPGDLYNAFGGLAKSPPGDSAEEKAAWVQLDKR